MTESLEESVENRRKGFTLTEALILGALTILLTGTGYYYYRVIHSQQNEAKKNEITLKVTEDGGRRIYMYYGGMPNSDTFTFYCSGGGNIYYPVETGEIYFQGEKSRVIYVNPEEIKLERVE